MLILLLVLIILLDETAAFHMTCPHPSERYLRSKAKCLDYRNYTCLFDENQNSFSESCSVKFDFQRPGYRVTLRTHLNAEACPDNLYQPFIFFTNKSSNCEMKRTFCSEEGQIVSNNGTGRTNRQCRCDYAHGYLYTTQPTNICSCDPSTEDCSCYRKKCSENHILSPDYQCIDEFTWSGKFLCSSISDFRIPKVTVSSNGIFPNDVIGEVLRMKRTTRLEITLLIIFLVLTYLFIFKLIGFLERTCYQDVTKSINNRVLSNKSSSKADPDHVASSDEDSGSDLYKSALDLPTLMITTPQDAGIAIASISKYISTESVSKTSVTSYPSDINIAINRKINSNPVKRKKTADDIYEIQHKVYTRRNF